MSNEFFKQTEKYLGNIGLAPFKKLGKRRIKTLENLKKSPENFYDIIKTIVKYYAFKKKNLVHICSIGVDFEDIVEYVYFEVICYCIQQHIENRKTITIPKFIHDYYSKIVYAHRNNETYIFDGNSSVKILRALVNKEDFSFVTSIDTPSTPLDAFSRISFASKRFKGSIVADSSYSKKTRTYPVIPFQLYYYAFVQRHLNKSLYNNYNNFYLYFSSSNFTLEHLTNEINTLFNIIENKENKPKEKYPNITKYTLEREFNINLIKSIIKYFMEPLPSSNLNKKKCSESKIHIYNLATLFQVPLISSRTKLVDSYFKYYYNDSALSKQSEISNLIVDPKSYKFDKCSNIDQYINQLKKDSTPLSKYANEEKWNLYIHNFLECIPDLLYYTYYMVFNIYNNNDNPDDDFLNTTINFNLKKFRNIYNNFNNIEYDVREEPYFKIIKQSFKEIYCKNN